MWATHSLVLNPPLFDNAVVQIFKTVFSVWNISLYTHGVMTWRTCASHIAPLISHHLDPLFNTGLVQCCKWLDRRHKCHLFCGLYWHVPASLTVNICMSALMPRTRCTSCRRTYLSALFHSTCISLCSRFLLASCWATSAAIGCALKGSGEFVMQSLPRIVLCVPKLLIFRARDCSALRAAKYCVCQGYL